ncbi:MAG TPA: hypothetical protein DDW49_10335 [Deltaproteobacteria bacterium]|nr:MAG: hypothetical protein A2048_08075 [Deltaproteobacteria bacterium GWA2_45_12]HBF13760.1 hypothetical protein [Deltaproteobacteria bacterium]
MNTKIRLILFVVLVLGISFVCPQISCAECDATACVTTIKRLYIDSSQTYIWPEGNDTANLGCSLISDKYIRLLPSHSQYKEIYAALLLGYSMGKTMGLRISGNQEECTISYVTMN